MNYPTINQTIAVYLSYVDWQKEYCFQSPLAKVLLKEIGLLLDIPMPPHHRGGYSQWIFDFMYDIHQAKMVFPYSIN